MKAKHLKKKVNKIRGVNVPEAITVNASIAQLSYIDALIDTSNFSDTKRNEMQNNATFEMTEGEAEELINMLLENQLCPIESGRNYGQGDIQKKLSQLK